MWRLNFFRFQPNNMGIPLIHQFCQCGDGRQGQVATLSTSDSR